MNGLSQEQVRPVVGDFYCKNREKGKAYSVKHFIKIGIRRTKLYDIMKKLDFYPTHDSLRRAPGSGGSNEKIKHANLVKLVMMVNHQTGRSQRKLAQKFHVNQSKYFRRLKELGTKYRKRQKLSKLTPEQESRQKMRLNKLAKRFFPTRNSRILVMDDESYLTKTGSGMSRNVGYAIGQVLRREKIRARAGLGRNQRIWC